MGNPWTPVEMHLASGTLAVPLISTTYPLARRLLMVSLADEPPRGAAAAVPANPRAVVARAPTVVVMMVNFFIMVARLLVRDCWDVANRRASATAAHPC